MARPTKRERESKRISQEKKKKKKLRATLRRCAIAAVIAVISFLAGGGWWFVGSGQWERLRDDSLRSYYQFTADSGFVLRHIYLQGREHTPMDKLVQAMNVSLGDPLFAVSPTQLRTRLESIDRVRLAQVERILPDTLHIQILEREPVAVWQNRGALKLVDGEGRVMEDAAVKDYKKLPLVVGEDGPVHTPQLLTMLASEPFLLEQVEAAIRVGERRWNVRFKNGIEVKLPEKEALEAWHRLASMEREEKIFSRAISTIDLRLKDRLFIKLAPDAVKPVAQGKET